MFQDALENTGLKWFICPGAVSPGQKCFACRRCSRYRVESKGAQETQKHVFFLVNFLDDLQRKFQLGNGVKRRLLSLRRRHAG